MNKVMMITGASRGIGAATARLAAQRGYAVCVNYLRSESEANKVVDDIRRSGANAIAVRADVGKEADVIRLFDSVDRALGAVTALVNNAGMLETQMRVDAMTADRLIRILTTNVVGAFLCAREAILRMSAGRGGNGGAIVNVSSIAARLGAPNEYVDYAASKGAVDALTIGLSKEVAGEGIRVNAVRPAYIYTDMHASGGEPGRIDRVKDSIPLKRGGNPEEVARAIMWLISDEASYTSGTFIEVAGGR